MLRWCNFSISGTSFSGLNYSCSFSFWFEGFFTSRYTAAWRHTAKVTIFTEPNVFFSSTAKLMSATLPKQARQVRLLLFQGPLRPLFIFFIIFFYFYNAASTWERCRFSPFSKFLHVSHHPFLFCSFPSDVGKFFHPVSFDRSRRLSMSCRFPKEKRLDQTRGQANLGKR